MIMQLYRWKYELVHGMSYFVYSQSIGEEWWEISIIFLVLSSTKGTEESSALDSIIIDLIKTCSFCTQINFFVIRWWCMGSQFDLLDAETNTPGEIHKFYECQWINLYKCMLTHYSMVTPYQLNYIPIRSWFILLHFISNSAFPPESRTRKAANFPSSWY